MDNEDLNEMLATDDFYCNFTKNFKKTIIKLNDMPTKEAKEEMIKLASMAEKFDDEAENHIRRVSLMAVSISEELAKISGYEDVITEEFVKNIELAALLHDVGKVGISKKILIKQARLTPQEFNIMKKHVIIGGEIFAEARQEIINEYLASICYDVIVYHHERYDGKGYTCNVARNDVPLCAQIVIIADIYDALRCKKCYKMSMPHKDACAIISKGKGTFFNPHVTQAFFACEEEISENDYISYENFSEEYDD